MSLSIPVENQESSSIPVNPSISSSTGVTNKKHTTCFSSTTSEQVIHQEVTVTIAKTEYKNNEFINFFSFKFLFLDQLVKGVAAFILAFGIVTTNVYFLRQILVDDRIANNAWKCTGIINSVFMLLVTILIIVCKILIYQNKDMMERVKMKTYNIFYLLIVIPACVLWISIIFTLIRVAQYLHQCFVISDITIPVSRLLFIMVSLLIIHDLISYRIKPSAKISFYLIYKSTAFLMFATCVSNLIYDFCDSESQFFQRFISNSIGRPFMIYCYNATWNETGAKLFDKMQLLTQDFSSIFHVLSVIVLIKPLNKIRLWNKTAENDNETRSLLDPTVCHKTPHYVKFIPKHLSLIIPLSIILLLLTFSPVILELMATYGIYDMNKMNVISISLPLLVYPICGILDIYLLKLLYFNYHLVSRKRVPMVPISLIWISLIGLIISVLKKLVANLYNFHPNNALNNLQIILEIFNILESVLQAMMLDYLFRLNWNCQIDHLQLTRIYYCCMPIIVANFGNLIGNLFHQVSNVFYLPPKDPFHELIFGILSSLSDPMLLIFRAICPVFLIAFINNVKPKGMEGGYSQLTDS